MLVWLCGKVGSIIVYGCAGLWTHLGVCLFCFVMVFALRFASGVSVWVSGFVCGFIVLSLPPGCAGPPLFFYGCVYLVTFLGCLCRLVCRLVLLRGFCGWWSSV